MRPSQTLTISLPPDLAEEVDRLARQEHRSRSELFREAFRRYVNSQRRWERILDLALLGRAIDWQAGTSGRFSPGSTPSPGG